MQISSSKKIGKIQSDVSTRTLLLQHNVKLCSCKRLVKHEKLLLRARRRTCCRSFLQFEPPSRATIPCEATWLMEKVTKCQVFGGQIWATICYVIWQGVPQCVTEEERNSVATRIRRSTRYWFDRWNWPKLSSVVAIQNTSSAATSNFLHFYLFCLIRPKTRLFL